MLFYAPRGFRYERGRRASVFSEFVRSRCCVDDDDVTSTPAPATPDLCSRQRLPPGRYVEFRQAYVVSRRLRYIAIPCLMLRHLMPDLFAICRYLLIFSLMPFTAMPYALCPQYRRYLVRAIAYYE